MQPKRVLFVAGFALLAASLCLAMYSVANKGLWPESWPWPLEALRDCARTLDHGQEVLYEIPFADRELFEAKWPFILTVKSKHAPLVLLGSPNQWLGTTITAGVRIHCPLTGHLVTSDGTTYPPGAEPAIKDKTFLKLGPPWPDYLVAEDGTLPEYATIDGDKWKALDRQELKGARIFRFWRVRTDIELIVDGKVVDLNRIELPADTPIVDKRFEQKK